MMGIGKNGPSLGPSHSYLFCWIPRTQGHDCSRFGPLLSVMCGVANNPEKKGHVSLEDSEQAPLLLPTEE